MWQHSQTSAVSLLRGCVGLNPLYYRSLCWFGNYIQCVVCRVNQLASVVNKRFIIYTDNSCVFTWENLIVQCQIKYSEKYLWPFTTSEILTSNNRNHIRMKDFNGNESESKGKDAVYGCFMSSHVQLRSLINQSVVLS